jgi:hypothetical protein
VIENDGAHLTFLPAVLEKGHVRVPVKGEDYPALITEKEATQIGARRARLFSRIDDSTLTHPSNFHLADRGPLSGPSSVRGVVVHNLMAEDVTRLAIFEGDEYGLQVVEVAPLAEQALSLAQQPELFADNLDKVGGNKVRCTTFVWMGKMDRLEAGVWE